MPFRALALLLTGLFGVSACDAAPTDAGPSADGEVGAQVAPNGAVVLQYHFVAEDTPRSTSVTPAELEAHLEHLAEHSFRVEPLDALLAQLQAGEDPPPRTVAITFDDGYRSVYTAAFPLLRERDLPFTIFVNPEAVDGGSRTFATWEQLREMQDAGALIANHGTSHAYLARRDPEAPRESEATFEARMEAELLAAERRIEAETGRSPKLLAYAYGEYDDRIRAWLRQRGWIGMGQHSGAVWSGSDFTALPRFPFSGAYADLEDFAEKVRMRPLPVLEATSLPDPTSATDTSRPTLRLTLPASDFDPARVACFASGQGAIPTELVEAGPPARVEARAPAPVPVGRSRYNCTAPTRDGHWRWFSQPWLRLASDMPAD